MAIVSRYVNNDLAALRDLISYSQPMLPWITCSYTQGNDYVDFYDSDENQIARISKDETAGTTTIDAYLGNNPTVSVNRVYVRTIILDAWKCNNGIILELYTNAASYQGCVWPIMFVKTNDGKTAIVFTASNYNNDQMKYGGFKCVSYGNIADSSYTDFSFTPNLRSCSIITPFPTKTDAGIAQYTYKSGFLPSNIRYEGKGARIREMVMNNVHYLTDTYIAIEDEGDVPPNTSST